MRPSIDAGPKLIRVVSRLDVTAGRFSTDVPYLQLGQGPPLLVAAGLTAEHASPKGVWRKMALSWAAPFAEHFTVYLANRRPGLPPGTTMSDIAADYAGAIEKDIGGPVFLHGTSTGGSVSLQLAVDRPELVQRLVVAAAACRLSPRGRQVQAEVARLVKEGDRRRASALLWGTVAMRPMAPAARGLGWVAGGGMFPGDLSDMLTTIAAEDVFDVEDGLSRVQAPTLVLGGTGDPFYTEELFRRTASGIPGGRAVVFPAKGHLYAAGSKIPAAIGLGFLVGEMTRHPTP